mgnify:CR=1 FL=1
MDHFGMFDYSFNSGLNGSLPTGLDYWLRNPNNFKGTSVQVPYQPLQDIPFALSKDQYTYYYQDDDDDVDDVGENELQVNIIFDRFANDTEWSWEQLWLDFNVSNSTTTLLLHPQDQQNNDSSSSSWKTIASFSSGPPGYMVSYTLLMEDDVVYRLTLTDSSGVLDDDGDDDEMNRHDQRSFEVSVIAGGTNNKNASVLIWHLFGYQFHASAQVSLRRNPNGTIETFDERIA